MIFFVRRAGDVNIFQLKRFCKTTGEGRGPFYLSLRKFSPLVFSRTDTLREKERNSTLRDTRQEYIGLSYNSSSNEQLTL